MDSIDDYFQYMSLSIYLGAIQHIMPKCACGEGARMFWIVLGLCRACFLGVWLGWLGCLRWDGCIHMLWWVGRLGSLSIGGTMPPIPWVMSSPQPHNHMHILSMDPPHTHTHLHTNPKEENENSLVRTITTTKHIWKNVEELSGCVWKCYFSNFLC